MKAGVGGVKKLTKHALNQQSDRQRNNPPNPNSCAFVGGEGPEEEGEEEEIEGCGEGEEDEGACGRHCFLLVVVDDAAVRWQDW